MSGETAAAPAESAGEEEGGEHSRRCPPPSCDSAPAARRLTGKRRRSGGGRLLTERRGRAPRQPGSPPGSPDLSPAGLSLSHPPFPPGTLKRLKRCRSAPPCVFRAGGVASATRGKLGAACSSALPAPRRGERAESKPKTAGRLPAFRAAGQRRAAVGCECSATAARVAAPRCCSSR